MIQQQPDRTYRVTRIDGDTTRHTISLYEGRVLVGYYSDLAKMPERDVVGGKYIILTGLDQRQFWFDVWALIKLDTNSYSVISLIAADANELYQERINEVYIDLCKLYHQCCCSGSDPAAETCDSEYIYLDTSVSDSVGDGQFSYIGDVSGGIIEVSNLSSLDQDFTLPFADLPDGTWLKFYNKTDRSLYFIVEISSYLIDVSSNTASWDAVIKGGDIPDDGTTYCFSWDIAGSGGSQGFQDVLIVDPDLTQNNETNANGTGYSWLDFSFWEIFASQYIEFNTVVGSQESDLYIDPDAASLSQSSSTETGYFRLRTTAGAVTAGISVSDTGSNSSETEMTAYDVITTVTDSSYTSQRYQDATAVTDSVVLATNTGEQNISPTVSRMAQINGVNEVNFLVDFTGGVQRNIIRTAKIVAGTAAVNDVLTLSATTGQAEWQAATGGGGGIPAATAAGTDTYTATMTPTVTSYVAGASYLIKFTNANTTVATLNLDGVGAISLVKDVSSPLNAGDIAAGKEILVVYDGTNFQTIGLSTYHAPFNIDCNSDTVNASTTSYYNIYPGSGVDGTEATRQNIVPVGGTAKGYAIQTLSAQGASGSLVFTMRKNGANTTLTVTVAAGSAATIVADNVNTFSVTKQSDLLSYQVQNNSTGTSAQIKSQSFVIESTQ
jgi:hypothetical protein